MKVGEHSGHRLVKAKNKTTTYQYFWDPKCKLVLKDTNFDGVV